MGRTAAGRMINQDIALSAKVASLSPESLALFCLLIPHFSSHGKMLANPHAIKGNVCPLIEWLTVERIESCLAEISAKTNVKWWRDEKGLYFLQSLNWSEHQDLRTDRLGADRLPDFSGERQSESSLPGEVAGTVPDDSGSNPGKVPPEVEVEVEVEEEGKKNPSSDALRLSGLLGDLIAGNNPKTAQLQTGKREGTISRWAKDMDRMIRLDGRSPEEVTGVIEWCQADSFWRCNILSGAKLREKYDTLLLQMQREGEKSAHGGSVVPFASGRRIY